MHLKLLPDFPPIFLVAMANEYENVLSQRLKFNYFRSLERKEWPKKVILIDKVEAGSD